MTKVASSWQGYDQVVGQHRSPPRKQGVAIRQAVDRGTPSRPDAQVVHPWPAKQVGQFVTKRHPHCRGPRPGRMASQPGLRQRTSPHRKTTLPNCQKTKTRRQSLLVVIYHTYSNNRVLCRKDCRPEDGRQENGLPARRPVRQFIFLSSLFLSFRSYHRTGRAGLQRPWSGRGLACIVLPCTK